MNPGTRVDHDRFCVNEGWDVVRNARGGSVRHHRTYELPLEDGRVLRTRISRPVDKTTYGASLWRAILRDQLVVTGREFWACVRDRTRPDRGVSGDEPPAGALPAPLVHQLIHQVGLTDDVVAQMTLADAMAALEAHWSRPPS